MMYVNSGKDGKFMRTLLLLWVVLSATLVTGRPEGVEGFRGQSNEKEAKGIGRNNVPENIQSAIQKYCGKCSESQKRTVEDVLLLLFKLKDSGDDGENGGGFKDSKFKQKLKKTMMKNKAKVTTPNPRDRWPSVPVPELASQNHYYYGGEGQQQQQVIAFPTISTTPSVNMLSSTTVRSAPAPAQSVEMPTPPLPPTTTGPIYFYYQTLSSSSLQPPTTSGVVESSVRERRGTTLQP